MKVLLKISAAAVLAAGLAGCQHTAPSRSPEPVDPPPPVLESQRSSTTTATTAGATAQKQSAPVITLHLAQENAEDSLIAIDVGGASLYALPQPVLIQTDIGRVSPVTAPDQRTFIMLEMNEQGIPKLHSITEQAQGHYLLLSVQGQLVSVAQIGETIRDGRLMVSTQSQQHTQAIINMMKGSD